MSNKTPLWLSALAALAFATIGSPAQAGIWSAQYDPPEYIGTGTFDVPDICLSSDGVHQQSDFVGCAIQIVGNVSTTPPVDFAPILPVALCPFCTFDVFGGAFVGVNTGVIGPYNVGDSTFWFQFVATGDPSSVSNVVNFYDSCSFDGPELFCSPPAFSATEGVVFSRVPEPGSLVLMLGALGAGWWVRRRKTAA
jgi:hypothetical protein